MSASGIDFPLHQLDVVRSILGLNPNTHPWDIVFVSLDFECKQDIPSLNLYSQIKEIGLSTLDTRSFAFTAISNPITTRHFVVGGHQELLKKAKLFHFGNFEHLDIDDIDETILKLLHIPDEKESVTH